MADLKTNYVDDVLDTTKNQLRKYQQIQNDDGTVSFVDVTEYTKVGTPFGAKDINDTNAAINDVNGNLTYSTEETICGKWIDGRKIYRVVKQVTSNINTNIVALSLPTASRVIDIKGTIETNENRTIPIHCTWETGLSIYAYYYQSEKNIYLNNKVGSGTAYIIVEYIK
jgi:hypothetical protein